MTIREKTPTPTAHSDRYPLILDIYCRVAAGVMMILGLRQWAIIVGLMDSVAGPFDTMTTPWKLATMHLAVVDLVAAVGLWQRVAWGNVVWFYAILAQVAMHTVFVDTFGSDFLMIGLLVAMLGVYLALFMLERRSRDR